jgi:hypothetical protein
MVLSLQVDGNFVQLGLFLLLDDFNRHFDYTINKHFLFDYYLDWYLYQSFLIYNDLNRYLYDMWAVDGNWFLHDNLDWHFHYLLYVD